MEYGNYTTQSSEKFPLDCEALETIQNNIKALLNICNIAGSNILILSGCTISGSNRTSGWVYIKNNDIQDIVYHPEQPKKDKFSIETINTSVVANRETFSNAYTKYQIKEVDNGYYNWSDAYNVSTLNLSDLSDAIEAEATARSNADTAEATARSNADAALQTAINSKASSSALTTEADTRANADVTLGLRIDNIAASIPSAIPQGIIVMWSGAISNIPNGWYLCDGTNNTPNLQNRFVVGAGDDYSVGATGGLNEVTLSEVQMPVHSHVAITTITATLVKKSGTGNTILTVAQASQHQGLPNPDPTFGTETKTLSTILNRAGGGYAHENRPPYYALAYIMYKGGN